MTIARTPFVRSSALLALLFASHAQSADGGSYLTLGTGFGNAREADIRVPGAVFESDELGDSPVFTGAFGWRFSENLRAELELAYHPDYAVEEHLSAMGTEIEVDAEISALSAMVNGYYDFPMGNFTPYVGVGIGASRNRIFDIRNTALNGPSAGLSVIGEGDTTTGTAYQVILGVDVPVNDNLSFNVAFHYVDLGKVKTASNTFGGTTTPPGEGELLIHDLRFGLRYTF